MYNAPTKIQLQNFPALYSTENIKADDKIIVEHFFIGGCDWYIAESDEHGLMFGFANLGDPQNAEWGYIDLNELKAIKRQGVFEVDRDLHWTPKKFSEVWN